MLSVTFGAPSAQEVSPRAASDTADEMANFGQAPFQSIVTINLNDEAKRMVRDLEDRQLQERRALEDRYVGELRELLMRQASEREELWRLLSTP
jgi:hypothetical protein